MECRSTAAKNFKSLVAKACHDNEERNGEKQMMETLTKMMNNSEYSDLVFVCNDGVCLYASRMWLCARSLVFLKELNPSVREITLDDISSPVLLIVFEFLYTGSVQSYKSHIVEDEMERWGKGLEVVRAARYLLLPDLENLIWNSLVMDVYQSIMDKDLTNTSIRLSSLREFMSEYDSTGNVEAIISLELIRILDRGWLGMPNVTHLSQEALLFFLENTQRESQLADDNVICLREYIRLRQVLFWCISQRVEVDSAVKTINECLPGAKPALQLLKETDNSNIRALDRSPRARLVPDSATVIRASVSSNFKTKFLPLINLRLIHPILLVKVLEPLKIISPARFMEAFRFHALKRLFRTSIPEYTWKHSGCFRISGDGTVLEKTRGPSGTAIVSSPAFWQDRVYEWHVIIDKLQISSQNRCEFQWEIGMLTADTSEISFGNLTNVLSNLDNGWALRKNSEGKIFVKQASLGNEQTANWMLYGTVPCSAAEDSSPEIRVRVRLNMLDGTCSFSWNDVDLGLAWTDLPPKYYFPAVSFGSVSGPQNEETFAFGKTRVELLDGFEVEEELPLRKKPRSVSSRHSGSSISSPCSSPGVFQSSNVEVASTPS